LAVSHVFVTLYSRYISLTRASLFAGWPAGRFALSILQGNHNKVRQGTIPKLDTPPTHAYYTLLLQRRERKQAKDCEGDAEEDDEDTPVVEAPVADVEAPVATA